MLRFEDNPFMTKSLKEAVIHWSKFKKYNEIKKYNKTRANEVHATTDKKETSV